MRTWLAPVFALSVVLSACGGDEDGISEVVVGGDDQTLMVRVDGTGLDGEVSVDESTEEVRLSGSGADECGEAEDCMGPEIQIVLDAPLGDRVLIDTTTGDEVEFVEHCTGPPPEHLIDICADLAAEDP